MQRDIAWTNPCQKRDGVPMTPHTGYVGTRPRKVHRQRAIRRDERPRVLFN